jgi:hypothetical protein
VVQQDLQDLQEQVDSVDQQGQREQVGCRDLRDQRDPPVLQDSVVQRVLQVLQERLAYLDPLDQSEEQIPSFCLTIQEQWVERQI